MPPALPSPPLASYAPDSIHVLFLAVEVNWFGRKYSPRCRKEVVLSAGTIGSPFILLHSGIGPALQLKRLDVSRSS